MTEEVRLTRKQKLFVDYYLQSFNATDAARRAGYSEKTAYAMGWENLRKPEIKKEVDARLEEVHMSADEALKRLADMARGDIGEFANSFGGVDWVEAKQKGLTKLVKKWKVRTVTVQGKGEEADKEIVTEEIELHDPQAALDKILRVAGRYRDNLDVTSGGQPIELIVKYATNDKLADAPPEAK